MTTADIPWSVLPDYRCFGCSPRNDSGLQLRFTPRAERELATTFTLPRERESYPGIVHGGLVGVICDETMGNLIVLRKGLAAFTMSMRLVYISPLAVGAEYTCVATLRDGDGDVVRAASEVLDSSGEAMATATASYRLTDLHDAREHIHMSDADADALRQAIIEHQHIGGNNGTDT